MNYNELIAKSEGLVSLRDHSLLVGRISKSICKSMGVDKKITDLIIISCLLHDVGKCNEVFQRYIKFRSPSPYIPHNVLSWAFLSRYLTNSNNELKHFLISVLTHHVEIIDNTKPDNDLDEYINSGGLTEADIQTMIGFTEYIINEFNPELLTVLGNLNYHDGIDPKPSFYEKTEIDKLSLYRSILVSSDRAASKLNPNEISSYIESDHLCDVLVGKIISRNPIVVNLSDKVDMNRYNAQLGVVKEISDKRTVVLSAPAGYGKTILGILWAIKNNRKLIWVCPRNEVAGAVYRNILNDLKLLGVENISVELFLTSRRKKCTDSDVEIFSSDIVVTNIDNYLFPTTKSSVGDRQFLISAADVVFDEFHETITTNAMFALFSNIVKMRVNYTNSKTLLLSATPSLIHNNWNRLGCDDDHRVWVYPEQNHLPAIHNKPYIINTWNGLTDNIDVSAKINSRLTELNTHNAIVFAGTISNSQILSNHIDADYNIHSNFIPEHREEITENIYNIFDKESKNSDKVVVSTSILGCAADISTQHSFGEVLSPETFIQMLLGRCNRFGRCDSATIDLFMTKNQSQSSFVGFAYNTKLMMAWYGYIKTICNGKSEFTADELYQIYNDFNRSYKVDIDLWIKTNLIASTECLCKINPRKYLDNLNVSSCGGNSEGLRGNSKYDIYYLVKHESKNEFYLFNDNYIPSPSAKTIHEWFNEDSESDSILTFFMKAITSNPNYDNYKYSHNKRYIENISCKKLAVHAYDPNKPYIATKWHYNDKYGILNNKTREKFKK